MRGLVHAVLQIESGVRGVCGQAGLDHGEGHVGLEADDRQLGASKSSHGGAVGQDVGGEGIDQVESGDVDDHPAGALLADAADEVALEPSQWWVVECGVDRANQLEALAHDRHRCRSGHRAR